MCQVNGHSEEESSFIITIPLFLVVPGLCCFVGFFSSCGEQGLLSSCSVQASHCSDFSCCGAWALGHVGFDGWWHMGSVVATFRL